MNNKPDPLPKDPTRKYDPLAYRFEQAIQSVMTHMDRVEEHLDNADALIREGKIGAAKESLVKLHSSAGSCLGGIIYAQALQWAMSHPHIRIDRGIGAIGAAHEQGCKMSGRKPPMLCIDCGAQHGRVIRTPYDSLPRCFSCRKKLARKIIWAEVSRSLSKKKAKPRGKRGST